LAREFEISFLKYSKKISIANERTYSENMVTIKSNSYCYNYVLNHVESQYLTTFPAFLQGKETIILVFVFWYIKKQAGQSRQSTSKIMPAND
jgi:hypothetical protein